MSFIKKVTSAWDDEHAKMYKENYWYKAWYDTMGHGQQLKNKLEDLARVARIYLDAPEPLPEGCDKKEWEGYVLVLDSSIKKLLKESQEAVKLVKDIEEFDKKTYKEEM